jgi:ankyrin repeat protein
MKMDFLSAVARNDVEKVRAMIQSGIDVNSSFLWNSKDTYSPVIPPDMVNRPDHLQTDQEYQCKPLNIAVLGGHANMVRLLLSAGADINSKDGRGR